MRNGPGARALADSPSIRSWVGRRAVDPEAIAEIDTQKERAIFETKHGVTPEAWLEMEQAGTVPHSTLNDRIADIASLLVDLVEQ